MLLLLTAAAFVFCLKRSSVLFSAAVYSRGGGDSIARAMSGWTTDLLESISRRVYYSSSCTLFYVIMTVANIGLIAWVRDCTRGRLRCCAFPHMTRDRSVRSVVVAFRCRPCAPGLC